MSIREAEPKDFESIRNIFQEIVEAGETSAFSQQVSEAEARHFWFEEPEKTYVFEKAGKVLGAYRITTNQAGPGSHVCNCFYMVTASSRGQGVATEMCIHSQQVAVEMGYEAIQFNYVATSNAKAVKLWLKLGFKTVGRIPRACKHAEHNYSDVLIMYKWVKE